MKKLFYIASLFVFVLSSCSPMSDIYDDLDAEKVANPEIFTYKGIFTGSYPGGQNYVIPENVEAKVGTQLDSQFPNKQTGLEALIRINVGDKVEALTDPSKLVVTEGYAYTLVDDDYDSMGTDKYQPGEYNNFSSSLNPDEYLPDFLTGKYADAVDGTIAEITYNYYSSGVTAMSAKYQKNVDTWEAVRFATRYQYTLIDTDYKSLFGQGHSTFSDSDTANSYLLPYANNQDAYAYANEGDVLTITWTHFYIDSSDIKHYDPTISYFQYDGKMWNVYTPFEDYYVAAAKDAYMVLENDNWKLKEIRDLEVVITMDQDKYKKIVAWTNENKVEYLETEYKTSEFYYGADSHYSNFSYDFTKWKKYDTELESKTDDEIYELQAARLLECCQLRILPDYISNPVGGYLYSVVYNQYKGADGGGMHKYSFTYNESSGGYEPIGDPVKL